MSGRQESDERFLSRTRKVLAGCNEILTQYYIYLETNRTACTVFDYISKLKTFFKYLEEDGSVTYERLALIKPVNINMYLNWYKNKNGKIKSDNSMALMFNVVNSFFKYLLMNDYIEKNPCEKLKAQKVRNEKQPTVLTEEEVKRIADCILTGGRDSYDKYDKIWAWGWRIRDYLFFMIACRTGLRISAICSIDVDDIDFERNCITVVEKEKETREVYFGEDTKKIITKWLYARSNMIQDKYKSNALFITRKSQRITTVAARNMLERNMEIIEGKHLTPHKLRATCATMLYNETGNLYLVSEFIGHKNVNTTKIYTSVAPERKKQAANMLDSLF